ncbi:hypothetical protein QR680_008193 [Steinernema hermaphroditum]|nr:hypothetical protein QR680_008193 [Steinernema hermaphroditum]
MFFISSPHPPGLTFDSQNRLFTDGVTLTTAFSETAKFDDQTESTPKGANALLLAEPSGHREIGTTARPERT